MNILELKEIVHNFNIGNHNHYPDYVSVLTIEHVLKKHYQELADKTKEFQKHVSHLMMLDAEVSLRENKIIIKFDNNILSNKKSKICIHYWGGRVDFDCYDQNGCYKKSRFINVLKNDDIVDEFIDYFIAWNRKFNTLFLGYKTSVGLFININLSPNEFKILFGDRNHGTMWAKRHAYHYGLPTEFYEKEESISGVRGFYIDDYRPTDQDEANFYYFKNILTNENSVTYVNKEVQDFLNEELIGKLYVELQVDIANFDQELQDELRHYDLAYQAGISEAKAKEMDSLRKLQVDRIMKAYSLFKELTELLNNAKMDLPLEKIKLENLEHIIFKNNGLPNQYGAIEFEDFFRQNMILRMLDLSNLDLTSVDIRGIDFSGTNIHINPQTIFNKDMTEVNASGVKFSPFSDSFVGVILDGAIITDYEASIHLSEVKSYNEKTVIIQEVIEEFKR